MSTCCVSVCVVYIYYSIRLCLIILPIRAAWRAYIRNFDAATPPAAGRRGRGSRLPRAAVRGSRGRGWPGSGCALRLVSASPSTLIFIMSPCGCERRGVKSQNKIFRRKKGTLLHSHTQSHSHTRTRVGTLLYRYRGNSQHRSSRPPHWRHVMYPSTQGLKGSSPVETDAILRATVYAPC